MHILIDKDMFKEGCKSAFFRCYSLQLLITLVRNCLLKVHSIAKLESLSQCSSHLQYLPPQNVQITLRNILLLEILLKRLTLINAGVCASCYIKCPRLMAGGCFQNQKS